MTAMQRWYNHDWWPTEAFYGASAGVSVTLLIADVVAVAFLAPRLPRDSALFIRLLTGLVALAGVVVPALTTFFSVEALAECAPFEQTQCAPSRVDATMTGIVVGLVLLVAQTVMLVVRPRR